MQKNTATVEILNVETAGQTIAADVKGKSYRSSTAEWCWISSSVDGVFTCRQYVWS